MERAPHVRLGLVAPGGHGLLVHVASLDPYDLETLVDDVRRAGPGAHLEIAWHGRAAEARHRLAPVLARLVDRGVEVHVRPDDRDVAPDPASTGRVAAP